jgi:subtilase family serine protease
MVPYLKSTWNRKWLYVGILISSILILSWLFTNSPEQIFGLNAPYDDISLALEVMQIIFIASTVVIIINGRDNLFFKIFKRISRDHDR